VPRIDTPVREFLTRAEGQLVGVSDSVAQAAAKLANLKTGCVLVEREGALAGIFTERDFLVRVVGPGKDPSALAVGDVMTPDPECVEEWVAVAYAIERMAAGGYRNIPIVTKENRPIGVLTIFDVIDYLIALFKDEGETDIAESGEEWLDIGGG
jgi:CBS domain-containing protein